MSEENANPYESPQDKKAATTPKVGWHFSLPIGLALLGVIALLCFFNLGAGLFLAVVSVPAYLRSVRKSSVQAAEGFDVTNLDRFLFFLGSTVLVLFIATTTFIAFFITCTGSLLALDAAGVAGSLGYGNGNEFIAPIAASAVGLIAFVWQYWRSWPRVKPNRAADVKEKSGENK